MKTSAKQKYQPTSIRQKTRVEKTEIFVLTEKVIDLITKTPEKAAVILSNWIKSTLKK